MFYTNAKTGSAGKLWLFFTALLMGMLFLCGCSSVTKVGFLCNERQIEIFVDDEYLGRDMVYYTVPKGRKVVDVSCRENGLEVYHRRINVENRNGELIELQIPKNYKYSNKPY